MAEVHIQFGHLHSGSHTHIIEHYLDIPSSGYYSQNSMWTTRPWPNAAKTTVDISSLSPHGQKFGKKNDKKKQKINRLNPKNKKTTTF